MVYAYGRLNVMIILINPAQPYGILKAIYPVILQT